MSYLIETPCGKIQGAAARQPHTGAFKGIRYATAGRWEYPRVIEHWEGVYDASHYGPCAPQQRAYVSEAESMRPFYYNEFRKDVKFTYSEDCQYLNIFAPDGVRKAPVIIYIHGGAFVGGSCDEKCFDEPIWPQHGVVAVTLNYRLGPFGFACFEECLQRNGHTGNYGLYDQLAAIRWIHDNIVAFGGDPDNVTLMGQSAGARSVQHLMCSPFLRGLVHRAVMSSGGGQGRMFGQSPDMIEQCGAWKKVMNDAGVRGFEEFKELDTAKIMAIFGESLAKDFLTNRRNSEPVMDNRLILCQIGADEDRPMDIPCLIGSNSQDMAPESMNQDACEWAEGHPESYAWFFERQLPGDSSGAFHSADLWYWFGTLDRSWRPMTETDRDLSRTMVQYLVNFARTGNPNTAGQAEWLQGPCAGGRLMCFGKEIKMAPVRLAEAAGRPMGW